MIHCARIKKTKMTKARVRKIAVISLLMTCLVVTGFAQDRLITGKIQNSNGLGIEGATVETSTTHRRAITDTLGFFRINASGADKTLEVSSVGFLAQSKALGLDNSYNITLADDPKSLADVVVTAFGIKKETKRIGYSVQEVKGAELTKSRDANPINALVGKVAGLTVGANPEMLGRPELVLRGSKDLLFVVDGVPINTDTWNISPDDIESYTVLKGANASALYGFRGLNGAIVITTKRGTKDRKGWQVDLNTSTYVERGFLVVPKSQVEYGRGTNFAYSYGDVLYDNKQRLPTWGPRFEGQAVKQFDSPWDPVAGIRTPTPWTARGANNFDKFMQDGVINSNNISLSSANDRGDIRISFSNMNQKGMAPNTNLHTYNMALNAGYNITSKLRIEASANLNRQYSPNIPDVNYGPNSYIYLFKVYGSSDYNVDDLKDVYKGPQGVQDLIPYAQEYGRHNSAWFIAKKWMRSHDKNDVNGYIKASYKITHDLNLILRTQFTSWNLLRTEKVPAGTNLNTYTPWYYFGWYGDYREERRNLFENNTDLILNYDHRFRKIAITGLVGGSSRSFSYNSLYGTTKALAIPNVYVLTNSKEPYSSYTWGSKMQVYSGFYSFDIAFDRFLTLSHTGRVDHLSTLPSGSNTFYYPSVSLSTVISDYVNMPSAISLVKVRASFADVKGGLTQATVPSAFTQITGNSTNGGLLGYGSDLYTSYDGPSYANQNAYSLVSLYNGLPSVSYSSTIANPALKPFNRTSYEGGLDVKFFKDRFGFDFTYFTSLNGPQIFALPVAASTSYSNQNVNGITSRKVGYEFSLNGTPIRSAHGLNWYISLNMGAYKETLQDIYGSEKTLTLNGHNYKKGERLDAIFSSGFVRDVNNKVIYSGGLPLRAPSDISNNTFLGYANPDYSWGIYNRFTFHNFVLSFQFDGRMGGRIFNEIYKDGMNGGTAIESATGAFGDARLAEWKSTNTGTVAPTGKYIADGVKIVSGTPTYANGQITNMKDLQFAPNDVATTVQKFISSGIGNVTEYWMTDRSFAKLREVSLGYSFPSSMLGNGKYIKGISISLIGRNLIYWAKRKDIDLDQFASGFSDTDKSLNNGGLLQSVNGRRFGINLNLSF
jgi:TonB-linked SusC/RagA family outer membrane protein